MPLSLPALRRRLPLLLILGLSLALSFALIAVRVLLTQQLLFVFLLWNLFLAAIPFGLSAALYLAARPPGARLLAPIGIVWLLFFPNAPYLVPLTVRTLAATTGTDLEALCGTLAENGRRAFSLP